MEPPPPLEDGSSGRWYCPFPGCKRSFAELWRLKVHHRAPPDIRGSGRERGHGTELAQCPKCGKNLKPGKHHVGCAAGRTAPRQASKRSRSGALAAAAAAAAAVAAAAAAAGMGVPASAVDCAAGVPPIGEHCKIEPAAVPPLGTGLTNQYGLPQFMPPDALQAFGGMPQLQFADAPPQLQLPIPQQLAQQFHQMQQQYQQQQQQQYQQQAHQQQYHHQQQYQQLPPPQYQQQQYAPPQYAPQQQQQYLPPQPPHYQPPAQQQQQQQQQQHQYLPHPQHQQQHFAPAGMPAPAQAPSMLPTSVPAEVEELASEDIHDMFDGLDDWISRVPSPPPQPAPGVAPAPGPIGPSAPLQHMQPPQQPQTAPGPGLLFNFAQFQQPLPPRPTTQPVPYMPTSMLPTLEGDGTGRGLWGPDATYEARTDGEMMQLLFGAADQPPEMATIHLHQFLAEGTASPAPPPITAAAAAAGGAAGGANGPAGAPSGGMTGLVHPLPGKGVPAAASMAPPPPPQQQQQQQQPASLAPAPGPNFAEKLEPAGGSGAVTIKINAATAAAAGAVNAATAAAMAAAAAGAAGTRGASIAPPGGVVSAFHCGNKEPDASVAMPAGPDAALYSLVSSCE